MKVRSLAVILSALLITVALVLIANRVVAKVAGSKTEKNQTQDDRDKFALVEAECRRTIDRNYVADERGRVCTWKTVDYRTGCCPVPEIESSPLIEYSCHFCFQNCCSVYAYCVSCCLNPSNQMVAVPGQKSNDKFDYCLAACRTSSLSVVNEKQWKSPMKYCYPKEKFNSNTNAPRVDAHPVISINNDIESYPSEDNTLRSEASAKKVGENSTDSQNSTESSMTIEHGVFKANNTQENSEPSKKSRDVIPPQSSSAPPPPSQSPSPTKDDILLGLQEKVEKLVQENQQLSTELEVHKRESERLAHRLEQDNTAKQPIRETEQVKANPASSNFSGLLAIFVVVALYSVL